MLNMFIALHHFVWTTMMRQPLRIQALKCSVSLELNTRAHGVNAAGHEMFTSADQV